MSYGKSYDQAHMARAFLSDAIEKAINPANTTGKNQDIEKGLVHANNAILEDNKNPHAYIMAARLFELQGPDRIAFARLIYHNALDILEAPNISNDSKHKKVSFDTKTMLIETHLGLAKIAREVGDISMETKHIQVLKELVNECDARAPSIIDEIPDLRNRINDTLPPPPQLSTAELTA
ncbi:MAG: hypothetical protein KDI13_05560 [Alphaproteobacteria bacterium]|nr:hypothetical protein [Alphaproteobacteria bacterium]